MYSNCPLKFAISASLAKKSRLMLRDNHQNSTYAHYNQAVSDGKTSPYLDFHCVFSQRPSSLQPCNIATLQQCNPSALQTL